MRNALACLTLCFIGVPVISSRAAQDPAQPSDQVKIILCYTATECNAVTQFLFNGSFKEKHHYIFEDRVENKNVDLNGSKANIVHVFRPSKYGSHPEIMIPEIEAVFHKYQNKKIVLLGFGLCGAMKDSASVGDIVVVTGAYFLKDMAGIQDLSSNHRANSPILSKEQLILLKALDLKPIYSKYKKPRFRMGQATTVMWFPGPTERQGIAKQAETWVIEMEEFHIIRLAKKYSIPYLPIRVIANPLVFSKANFDQWQKEITDQGYFERKKDQFVKDGVAREGQAWQNLDEAERLSIVLRYHYELFRDEAAKQGAKALGVFF